MPAAFTPDLKGLHYLTAANQVQLDRLDKSPAIQNGGAMFVYSPWEFRCCQHNVSRGWPCETRPDRFNRTTFHPVQTRGLRLEVELQPGFSGGILQWKIVE